MRRTLSQVCAKWNAQHVLPGWRNHQRNLRQFKDKYRRLQNLKHSTSKDEAKKAIKNWAYQGQGSTLSALE